jgi:site-specific recombinase XerD
MDALGLAEVSHHTMRHSGVTMMLEHGINPRVIQFLACSRSISDAKLTALTRNRFVGESRRILFYRSRSEP